MKNILSSKIRVKNTCVTEEIRFTEGETDCMEHKGGRIKDHIRREEPQGQDDWMDVEWLDDDEDLDSQFDTAVRGQEDAPDASEEEQLEIEDWRDEENWNLDKKEEAPKSEPAKESSPKRKNTGTRSTDGQNPPRKRRPQQQRSGTGKDSKSGKKPVKKAPQKDTRKDAKREQEQRDQDRQKKNSSTLYPTPQTVLMKSDFPIGPLIFSRRCLICTMTVLLLFL